MSEVRITLVLNRKLTIRIMDVQKYIQMTTKVSKGLVKVKVNSVRKYNSNSKSTFITLQRCRIPKRRGP